MRLVHAPIVLMLGAAAALAPAEPPPAPVPASHQIDPGAASQAIGTVLEESGVPALSVAMADDQSVFFADAEGVRVARGSSEVTADEPFHIGSCSKAMTATLVAMLVEEGKLRWDMTLAEALPDIADAMNQEYKAVTIGAMLRHRAGFPSFTKGVADENQLMQDLPGTVMEQRAEFARRLLTAEPANPPGEYLYSNGSYGIAAAIAEHATGVQWEDLMRERLFKPLGMTTAGFGWPATKEHAEAPRGHYADQKLGLRPQPLDDSYELPTAIDAAGDIHCSASDLARFCQLHLRGLMGQDTPLLKSETIKELHRPDGDYACGWGVVHVSDHTISMHDGSAGTFYTRVIIIPDENILLVVDTNSGAGINACAQCANNLFTLAGVQ